jgi:hypothetical protein
MKKLLLIALLICSHQAHAVQFWTADFTITNLYVSGSQNYHYRVYGMPANPACPPPNHWVYVNEIDTGAKGQIAAILMAYASGKPIRVLVETDANQLCKIIEIFISG